MINQHQVDVAIRSDLYLFVTRVFHEVVPGTQFIPSWHLRAICHALTEVGEGRRRRQIIEVPPRSLKSICSSVALVAWLLGHDPTRKIICVSYSQELATRFSALTRQVIKSAWYRRIFPGTIISVEKDTESYFRTKAGGYRDSTSVGGTLTGNGADLIIVDDPAKPDDMTSQPRRDAVNEWFSRTLTTRLNNKRTDAILLVMQRLHSDDLAGNVRQQGTWEVLTIPAIAVAPQRYQLSSSKWYKRCEGNVLDPEREPREVLDEIKLAMGSRHFEAQYQQNPLAADGAIIEWRWFQIFDHPPEREGTTYIQSWDCASKNTEFSDFSVCTTWAVRGDNYYLLDIFRKKLIYPDLRRTVIEMAERWPVSTILIEEAAAGIQLCQELRLNRPIRMPVPIQLKPERDKETRAHIASPVIEQGRVSLPLHAPWLDDFRNELIQFPTGKHDDQVDSLTQFLAYMERKRLRGATIVVLPMFGGNRPPQRRNR